MKVTNKNRLLSIIVPVLFFLSFISDDFKNNQKRYPRVRKAYQDSEQVINNLLQNNSIEANKLRIYLRAFKSEKLIELWGKNNSDSVYKLIRKYDICRTSGELGPKRQQGDLQIPEGYYHINRFNPYSNFYLSLGINYPNKSDRILGVQHNLGGDIFIHGTCVTIGCLPITNDRIKELYVFCVEAKNNGQEKIPVTIFPSKLTDNSYNSLQSQFQNNVETINLWSDLKQGFDYFNDTKTLPTISFKNNGRHQIL